MTGMLPPIVTPATACGILLDVNASSMWVMSGPGLPCGARKLGDTALGPATTGRVWLDVCILGQHLPQMYRKDEARDLAAGDCARFGLCDHCLGFGDLGQQPDTILALARGVGELSEPCPGCGGTGRPALRITVHRDASGTQAGIRPLPHAYIPPLPAGDPVLLAAFQLPADMCLACGMPPDGRGPRGEALHP